jgi:hypothetical protein
MPYVKDSGHALLRAKSELDTAIGQKRMFFRGLRTSLCGASSLLGGIYHLDQSRHFVLGWSMEAAIPLCLGEFPSEIDFNSKE